ncbi:hypothetical protein Tco_0101471, partial [Tanacetum coccineum]
IRPIYNEEPMAEVQTTAEINIFATGQQHTEQPEFNNEGKTIELLNQLLESENVCLKKTVAQCLKDFSILEAHCINLELKYQNQVLKEGKQDQILNVRSNEAKVKTGIDVTETINIELEHSVAKLLAENEQLHKENEHLKQTYTQHKLVQASKLTSKWRPRRGVGVQYHDTGLAPLVCAI